MGNSLRKVHIFVVLLGERQDLLKLDHFSVSFQTQGNILNARCTQVGSQYELWSYQVGNTSDILTL